MQEQALRQQARVQIGNYLDTLLSKQGDALNDALRVIAARIGGTVYEGGVRGTEIASIDERCRIVQETFDELISKS